MALEKNKKIQASASHLDPSLRTLNAANNVNALSSKHEPLVTISEGYQSGQTGVP